MALDGHPQSWPRKEAVHVATEVKGRQLKRRRRRREEEGREA
jgi:hypothetical protein